MAPQLETCSAIVTDNQDPQKRGRIRVQSEELCGIDNDTAMDEWIEPALDWGWFTVPDVNEEVEIEFVSEDEYNTDNIGQAFFDAPRLRWKGVRFESKEGKAPRSWDPRLKTNYGKRRGFVTPKGHIIFFDDTDGDEQLTVSWTNKSKFAYMSFDKNGSCTLSAANGSLLFLDAENNTTFLVDSQDGGGNIISMDADGIKVVDKFSNIIELKESQIQILAQKDIVAKGGANITVEAGAKLAIKAGGDTTIDVTGNVTETITGNVSSTVAGSSSTTALSATVTAPSVSLNTPSALIGAAADSPFVRYLEWLVYESAHIHGTVFGPSSPPLVPPPPSIASITALVK